MGGGSGICVTVMRIRPCVTSPGSQQGGCHLSSVWCYQESQTSQGCCSFLPGNVRVSFEDQRGQIPSEKVTSSMQPESAHGCALPAADH